MSLINVKMGQFCIEKKAGSFGIIIFGASGDLTKRKLIPSIFSLYKRNLLPKNFYILGCSRTEISNEIFRVIVADTISDEKDDKLKDDFIKKCNYEKCNYSLIKNYKKLNKRIEQLEKRYNIDKKRIFYLAVPPVLYTDIVENLDVSGLSNCNDNKQDFARVIAEKPFGNDLKTSKILDRKFKQHLREDQIYRIDHYLGKETVQNILMFRFANIIFEAVWNRNYIDNIQLTVAETIGVGNRSGYFDRTGLLRDMFQNHILQVLSLIAMEPPISFNAENIRNEKVKLLKSIKIFSNIEDSFIRAQYEENKNLNMNSYIKEKDVLKNSRTETFVAAKLFIDNWRWKNVPFYIRSGKRLKKKVNEIAITFKSIPHSVFQPYLSCENFFPNVLKLKIQPDEGFSLNIQTKHPGPKLCIGTLELGANYKDYFGDEIPDAYERLLLDCMLGDQTLFIRSDDLEISWKIFDPVLKFWKKYPERSPLYYYKAGSNGPKEADEFIKKDNKEWVDI